MPTLDPTSTSLGRKIVPAVPSSPDVYTLRRIQSTAEMILLDTLRHPDDYPTRAQWRTAVYHDVGRLRMARNAYSEAWLAFCRERGK